MKKLQYILLALAFVLAGCNNKDSIWNVMDDMDSRIATLEVLCQEMNTNISALETLIKAQNNGDYITNITEIRNGSTVVGYTITFKNHEPVTIYNGTNGKDGHDGTDGYKPTVGAKQDTDGIYYWTVDGDWLTDANGNKIPVTGEKGDKGDKGDPGDKGQDGKDGQDGHDGINGVNGNTPQLKIDGGYWYISYDGGTNWTKLGKATGEDGKDGTNGTNGSDGAKGDKGEKGDKGDAGDTMFQSVTQDTNYVYFTLADGTLIKIAKNGSGNSGTHADDDFIEFKDLHVKSALLRHTPEIDTNHDGEISYAEAKATKRIVIHSNTDIVSFKELQYFEELNYVNFGGCYKLAEVVLPENLDSIGDKAFATNSYYENGQLKYADGCRLLEITIPRGCHYIGVGAFLKSELRRVLINGQNIVIGGGAFSDCTSLQEVEFSEGCISIGASAFNGCSNLTECNLPSSVIRIDDFAFYGTNLQRFIFPESLMKIGNVFGKNITGLPSSYYKVTPPKSIIWNATTYQEKFQILVGSSTDDEKKRTKSITFGENVTTIPAYLCYDMKSITSVTIPDKVVTIGDYAFSGCPLQTITIGKSVQSIGAWALSASNTIYVKAVEPPSMPSIGNGGISVGNNALIYVPKESLTKYRTAEVWKNYASQIVGYDFE